VNNVVIVNSEQMGHGDARLGSLLVDKFLQTIVGTLGAGDVLAFYNTGVKLICEGSAVLEPLRKLQVDGVELLACGTCLDHYELRPYVAVGRASTMREITGAMFTAERVITI
jgi:selenium metabolism protein YedF